MKRNINILSVTLGFLFVANSPLIAEDVGPLPGSLKKGSFEQHLENLKEKGWNTQASQNPTSGLIALQLKKQYKGTEKHGLLRVTWPTQDTWELLYLPQNDTLILLNAEGVREHKAPFFGEWEPIEKYDYSNMPDELSWKEPDDDNESGDE